MQKKTQVGDVFAIPVSGDSVCYGQVAAVYDPIFYMIAFDCHSDKPDGVDIAKIIESPIIFLGNFFDTLIKNGEWVVVGNSSPILDRIPFPCYQVEIEGASFVESWDGTRRRRMSPHEINCYDRRANCGPVWLEDAVKAHYGNGSDDTEFSKFRLEYVKARTCVISA